MEAEALKKFLELYSTKFSKPLSKPKRPIEGIIFLEQSKRLKNIDIQIDEYKRINTLPAELIANIWTLLELSEVISFTEAMLNNDNIKEAYNEDPGEYNRIILLYKNAWQNYISWTDPRYQDLIKITIDNKYHNLIFILS